MISTNVIELPFKFPYVSSELGKKLGKEYFNQEVSMFRYNALLPAYEIKSNGTVFYRKDLTSSGLLDDNRFTRDNKDHFYSAWGEELTPDLHDVAPFYTGKLKEGVAHYVTIQPNTTNIGNWVIIRFPKGETYNVFRHDITNLFLGALPSFRIKSLVSMYTSMDWGCVTSLIQSGLRSELETMATTICKLDLRFTEGDFTWLKNQ